MIGDIFQPTHLLFILVVALLVLGPKRLPEVGRALGKGLRDFRSALNSIDPREELHEPTGEFTEPIVADPVSAQPPAAPPTSSPPAPAPQASAPAPQTSGPAPQSN